jgi:Cdc6-like AAA superfamily ATPase
MNNQGFPNYFQFPIIDIKDGGSLQNEDCVPEYFNKDELFNNPLYFLKKDENGSKIIQDLYKKSSQNDKNIIFDKIKSDIKELSKNAFANYFLKELIKDNDNEKINFLYNTLKDDLYEFSSDSHGTYVIQELLKKLDQNIIEELWDEFYNHCNNQNFEEKAFDQNLNHVLQIFIKRNKMNNNDRIYEKIINKFDVYSKDKYGCYIIQSFLTNCKDDHYNKIYNETCKKFKELIKHESGTYLIVFF